MFPGVLNQRPSQVILKLAWVQLGKRQLPALDARFTNTCLCAKLIYVHAILMFNLAYAWNNILGLDPPAFPQNKSINKYIKIEVKHKEALKKLLLDEST